jgi:hypothetical protein
MIKIVALLTLTLSLQTGAVPADRSVEIKKLNEVLQSLKEASEKKRPKQKKAAIRRLEKEFAAPPADFNLAMDALLQSSRHFIDSKPDVPALATTSNLLLKWGNSPQMAALPQLSLDNWVNALISTVPKLGGTKRIAEYFAAHPEVKARLTSDSLVRLVHTLCTHYSEIGRVEDCRKEMNEAGSRAIAPGEYFNFHEAKNLYYSGQIDAAIEKMIAISNRADKIKDPEMVPGVFGVIATMQILEGRLDQGKTYFERFRKGVQAKEDPIPWNNTFYVPRIESLILIQEKEYARANKSLLDLRAGLVKVSEGATTTVMQARTDLLLVAVNMLLKNPKEAAKYRKMLKSEVAQLPTMEHLVLMGDGIVAVGNGTDPGKAFEAARKSMGPAHPDLKFIESLAGRIREGKPSKSTAQ